ncbi:LacI family DNA-binding transcriptional regulator [Amnibacterium flavum]|uniref:LacI family transcriptional regulator n=1 Tax=Amnibacterium flavum TaxID=2173173 RepID=A0A2V1HTH3_9MICO|nr:LacI family DNA-binding transcriptional regulator [Amnibacterium flavum]PVZ93394.1 LacI family transcriptional regulator [Amnibacterium flavum]
MTDRPGEGRVSIRDVARAAGVSPTTVSHALSGRRPVAPETARRIRALVPDLGYAPWGGAGQTSAARSFQLGLIVPDISNHFYADVAVGIEITADTEDYGVMICAAQFDPHRERRYFNLLRSGAIDGLVYIPGNASFDPTLEELCARYPVVIVDEPVPHVTTRPTIFADNVLGGRLAAEHLHSLGHERVAVFTGPPGLVSTEERVQGFHEIYPDALLLRGEYTEGAGRTLARVLAKYHPGVTAVFAGNDLVAFGAVGMWEELGLRVPDDISVLGFDDADFAGRMTPALSTIRQRGRQLGARAAELLIGHLVHGAELGGDRIALEVELVERASTAPPRV